LKGHCSQRIDEHKPDEPEPKRKSLTQRREDAKNPQSFSLRYLCGSAPLRESFCFFATFKLVRDYASFSDKPKTGAPLRRGSLCFDRITGSTGLNFYPVHPVIPSKKLEFFELLLRNGPTVKLFPLGSSTRWENFNF
jgi:hypothetical protein